MRKFKKGEIAIYYGKPVEVLIYHLAYEDHLWIRRIDKSYTVKESDLKRGLSGYITLFK